MKTSGQSINDKSFYRAGTLKRKRRTNTQLEQLDSQIIEILKQDHPQSVRHVFYRMTDPRLPESVEKSDAGYRHIQDRCVKLRRSGQIPYAWIADMSRRGYFVNTFSDASDFIQRMAGLYRADLWELSNYQCEVWCESRSIASVIQNDCNELAVPLYPCGGFSSLSFVHYAAEQHNRANDYRPLVIYYIGDYDQAGVLIDKSLERELRLHLDSMIDMEFDRIGINESQIAEYDLPTKPRKKGDTRSKQIAATVIQNDCNELAVPLYPCGGFSSLSFVHYAAEQHNRANDYRPLVIYYIGDYDQAGVLIDKSLERELRLHLDSMIDMEFDRIGINESQIAEYDLPTKPRKKGDTRSKQIAATVEAEAMPAHILRELLRNNIESLLPPGALHAAKVAEQSEREGLKLLASHARRAGGLL